MATNNPRPPGGPGDKGLVLRGIAWTSGYRVFASLAQFGAMLVLMRVIPPADYGRAGAIVGLLTLVNIFSCGVFINQALQLREGEEPNLSCTAVPYGLWLLGTLVLPHACVIVTVLVKFQYYSPST